MGAVTVASNDLHLVIMAGGSGTRFWPKSTAKRPKQLLSFSANPEETLIRQTLARFDGWVPQSAVNRMIVTTAALAPAIRAQVGESVTILSEPQGRNTAPCVYWAARQIAEKNPAAVMMLMPADHYIPDGEAFQRTLKIAATHAITTEELITLGVKPTRPETGYGYLRVESPPSAGKPTAVVQFVEKPSLDKAEEFLASGRYLWNGGMFVWKASTILAAFDRFMPEMKAVWDEAQGKVEVAYPKMTATSIDYGVMEKAKNVVTFALDCGWDDLGSWTSLESVADELQIRNAAGIVASGQVISVESSGNIVDAPGRLVALLGVKDLIVVEHEGSLLVAEKSRAQDIRKIVDELKKQAPERL